MTFREWIRLAEMGHVVDVPPVRLNKKKVKYIDLRTEMYPEPYKSRIRLLHYKAIAPLPGGGHVVLRSMQGQGSLSDEDEKNRPEEEYMLPPDWQDYAIIVYSDGTVKQPTKGV